MALQIQSAALPSHQVGQGIPDGRPVEREAGHAFRPSGAIGMLMVRSHARDGAAIPEQDREHGLVEREQASSDVEEEA